MAVNQQPSVRLFSSSTKRTFKSKESITHMQQHIKNYTGKLEQALKLGAMQQIQTLGEALREAWKEGRTIYFCGNGGSAGNAIHLANDLLYGAGVNNGGGLRAEALSANSAVLTCLANDIGYDQIYAQQLRVKANPSDVGNAIGMVTFAILAFSGGRCKELAQHPIHFEIDDMQIAEDLQLIVGHICMQWLYDNPLKSGPQ